VSPVSEVSRTGTFICSVMLMTLSPARFIRREMGFALCQQPGLASWRQPAPAEIPAPEGKISQDVGLRVRGPSWSASFLCGTTLAHLSAHPFGYEKRGRSDDCREKHHDRLAAARSGARILQGHGTSLEVRETLARFPIPRRAIHTDDHNKADSSVDGGCRNLVCVQGAGQPHTRLTATQLTEPRPCKCARIACRRS
jgi:hypothetical protein